MAALGAAEVLGSSPVQYNLFYRFLRLFADIRQGEAPKALQINS